MAHTAQVLPKDVRVELARLRKFRKSTRRLQRLQQKQNATQSQH